MEKGQIILVSGTSGAGKTTTITEFSKRSTIPYLAFGVDIFLGQVLPIKFSMWGNRTKEGWYYFPTNPDDPESEVQSGFGEVAWGAFNAMHDMIAAASNAGQNIIVDHILFEDPPVLRDCVCRLEGFPVLFVTVKPPREALMERLATREVVMPEELGKLIGETAFEETAKLMQRMTPWFYDAVYKNDCYDLVIDTTQHNPAEVCDLIQQRLDEGPGTAFDTLRDRYSKL